MFCRTRRADILREQRGVESARAHRWARHGAGRLERDLPAMGGGKPEDGTNLGVRILAAEKTRLDGDNS